MPPTSSLALPRRARTWVNRLRGNGDGPTPAASLVTQHGLVGLAGSIILALGAVGIGYLPPRSRLADLPIADTLRSTTTGSLLAKLFVVVGVVLLLQAWLMLGNDVRSGRLSSPRRLIRMFWYWAIPLAVAPPLFSQDLFSYTAQGNLLNVGFDPYSHGPSAIPGPYLEPVSTVWLDTPAPYGPTFLLFGKWTAQVLDHQVYLAAIVMRLFAMLGVLLIAIYLPRLARACGFDPKIAVWVGLLNPLILMHFVSGAHNDALMVGLVVAGLAYAMEGRPIVAALLVALGGTVKAPALLALGFVGLAWASQRSRTWPPRLRTRIPAWIAVSVVALGTFLVVNWISGLDFGWLSALDTPGMVRTWLSPITAAAMALGGLGVTLGMADHTDRLLDAFRTLGTAVTLGLVSWWLLRPRAIQVARGTGLGLLVMAVLGPVIQPWYLLWGLVVLAGAGMNRRELQLMTAGTAMFVVYGLVQSSVAADAILEIPDLWASLVAVLVGTLAIFGSRRARDEILGRGGWSDDWSTAELDSGAEPTGTRS